MRHLVSSLPSVCLSNLFSQAIFLSSPFLTQPCYNEEAQPIPKHRGCRKILHHQIASQTSLISFVTNPKLILFGSLKNLCRCFPCSCFPTHVDFLLSPLSLQKNNFRFVAFRDKSIKSPSRVFVTKRQTFWKFKWTTIAGMQQKQAEESVLTINPCKIVLFGQACLVTLARKSETC